jgi:DNA-binding CsgD family transcriptional regulator
MYNSMVYSKITLRKKEILTLLNNGLTDKEIGLELHISINTVKTHLKEIYRILEAKNRVHACTLYNKLNLNL